MDATYCPAELPDWDISCCNAPEHKGAHHGVNFTSSRIASWGSGYPTHVEWMPVRTALLVAQDASPPHVVALR